MCDKAFKEGDVFNATTVDLFQRINRAANRQGLMAHVMARGGEGEGCRVTFRLVRIPAGDLEKAKAATIGKLKKLIDDLETDRNGFFEPVVLACPRAREVRAGRQILRS